MKTVIAYLSFLTFLAQSILLAMFFKAWLFARKNNGEITSVTKRYLIISIVLFIINIIFSFIVPYSILKLSIIGFVVTFVIIII